MLAPIILIGGGGHASVVLEALLAAGEVVAGYCDKAPSALSDRLRLHSDDEILARAPGSVRLACGLGLTPGSSLRERVIGRFAEQGHVFTSVIHPSAVIASTVVIEDGAQVMMGACVQPGGRIGCHAIINTGARVDHDCQIGQHAHLGPGALLAGGVTLGRGVFVGAGATIINGISIGDRAIVGAGACVIRPVPEAVTVVGVPARGIKGE